MKTAMWVVIAISSALLILFLSAVEKKNSKKNKKSSFESGFDSIMMKKMTFSTNFMMLTMMFLIFDAEVSLLIPMITMNKSNMVNTNMMSIMIILLLISMMTKEWKQGSLEWIK